MPPIHPMQDIVPMLFNRSPFVLGAVLPAPSESDIRAEPTFWREDYERARKDCGDVMREVLERIPIVGDRNRIFVTVKVQHLEEGMYPADTSGMLWHVDCPINVTGPVKRALGADQVLDIYGREAFRPPRIHMYTNSEDCATEFIDQRGIELRIGKCIRDFRGIDVQVRSFLADSGAPLMRLPANRICTNDAWELHRGVESLRSHWRLWVRVSEMDSETLAPPRNPNAVYRRSSVLTNGGLP